MKTKITFLLAIALLLVVQVYAQKRVTIPAPAYLNESILGDTLPNGTREDKIYVLQRGGTYYVRGAFENINFKLHMVAEEGTGAMPIVRADLADNGTQNWYMIAGQKDVEVENIFFDAQSDNEGYGPANWCFVYFGKDANLTFRNCVFANTGQGGVGAWNAVNVFTVDNCKFYNMGNISFSDQGAGRMVECRDSQIEKLIITNNTVVNSYDRLVRHRNGAGAIKEMIFSNNTIINNGGYFGVMELGNVGRSITITNNLVIDAMSFGADQNDAQRLTEFNMHGETDASGKNKIVWIGSVRNDTTVYTISNNIYSISPELAAFYSSKNVNEGPILTDHIKGKLANPEKAWIKKNVSVVKAPAAMIDLVSWYYQTRTKGVTPDHDYVRMTNDYMLNTLNCKYSVTDADFLGTDGKPVGDPKWGSSVISSVENYRFNTMELANYPNPFSNQTTLRFTLTESSEVSIEISDITGKQLRTESHGRFDAGSNSILIDKKELKSGMYFLRLHSQQENGTLVMVVK